MSGMSAASFTRLAVGLGRLAQLQAESHVVVDAHVNTEHLWNTMAMSRSFGGTSLTTIADQNVAGDLLKPANRRRLVVLQPDGPKHRNFVQCEW